MFLLSVLRLLRTASRVLFIPGFALVVWGELRPSIDNPQALPWDKLLHFTAYFGLAAMASLALRGRRSAAVALLALIVFGGFLEIVQGYVGRDADVLDELANTLGALAGYAAGWAVLQLHGKLVGSGAPT
jgi:VanZ family protein